MFDPILQGMKRGQKTSVPRPALKKGKREAYREGVEESEGWGSVRRRIRLKPLSPGNEEKKIQEGELYTSGPPTLLIVSVNVILYVTCKGRCSTHMTTIAA